MSVDVVESIRSRALLILHTVLPNFKLHPAFDYDTETVRLKSNKMGIKLEFIFKKYTTEFTINGYGSFYYEVEIAKLLNKLVLSKMDVSDELEFFLSMKRMLIKDPSNLLYIHKVRLDYAISMTAAKYDQVDKKIGTKIRALLNENKDVWIS